MYYDINGSLYLSTDASYYDTNVGIEKFFNKNVMLQLKGGGELAKTNEKRKLYSKNITMLEISIDPPTLTTKLFDFY